MLTKYEKQKSAQSTDSINALLIFDFFFLRYSKISASNGPPGFSQAQVNAFTQMLNNSDSKPKFDYDMPLEALLDDGGDDIDNEAEILMWIKDFLTNELGKLGVNVPMLLMNNIRSLGSDELVLQVR